MDKPCYCPSCQKAYRAWMRKKYGTLGALNEAGGAAYSDWEELGAPQLDGRNLGRNCCIWRAKPSAKAARTPE